MLDARSAPILGTYPISLYFPHSFTNTLSPQCPHPVYAFSLFLPTIINDLGYAAARAQLLSTPPYVARCTCTVAIGIISDKYKSRGPFVYLSTTVGIIGYSILYGTKIKGPHGDQVCCPSPPFGHLIHVLMSAQISYGGTVIAACGMSPSIAVILACAGGPARGDIKRGVVLAMTIGEGNCRQSAVPHRPRDCHWMHGHVVRRLSFVQWCE